MKHELKVFIAPVDDDLNNNIFVVERQGSVVVNYFIENDMLVGEMLGEGEKYTKPFLKCPKPFTAALIEAFRSLNLEKHEG